MIKASYYKYQGYPHYLFERNELLDEIRHIRGNYFIKLGFNLDRDPVTQIMVDDFYAWFLGEYPILNILHSVYVRDETTFVAKRPTKKELFAYRFKYPEMISSLVFEQVETLSD